MRTFLLIERLGNIPDGRQITKIRGGVKYTVRDELRVYGLETIIPITGKDVKFLVGPRGDITACPVNLQVVYEVSDVDLMAMLESGTGFSVGDDEEDEPD